MLSLRATHMLPRTCTSHEKQCYYDETRDTKPREKTQRARGAYLALHIPPCIKMVSFHNCCLRCAGADRLGAS